MIMIQMKFAVGFLSSVVLCGMKIYLLHRNDKCLHDSVHFFFLQALIKKSWKYNINVSSLFHAKLRLIRSSAATKVSCHLLIRSSGHCSLSIAFSVMSVVACQRWISLPYRFTKNYNSNIP